MEEQKETIPSRLWRYVRTLSYFVRLLIGLMLDRRVEPGVKIFAAAVVAYVAAPIDFIPEILQGLFGMLDDFVLSAFAINVILNWVDPEIVKSHWKGDQDLLETIQKAIKTAEILIPDAIMKKIHLWIGKHADKAAFPVQTTPPALTSGDSEERGSQPE